MSLVRLVNYGDLGSFLLTLTWLVQASAFSWWLAS